MSQLHPLLEKNAFQRLEASLATIKAEEKLFILKDEHGCVMLTTDEEDGVPVWPDAELALLWATEDWAHCEAMELSTEGFWLSGCRAWRKIVNGHCVLYLLRRRVTRQKSSLTTFKMWSQGKTKGNYLVSKWA